MSKEGGTFPSPREAITFHPVKGGGVLFNAADGRLYALNPVAGLTWLCVRDGLSRLESTLAIADAFKVDRTVAAEWFDTSTDRFQGLGLFKSAARTEIAAPRGLPETLPTLWLGESRRVSQVDYRLFDQFFRIAVPLDLQAAIDSLLGSLRIDPFVRRPDGPGLQIDIVARGDAWDIAVDRQLEVSCETASVVAEVERLLVQAVVPTTPHLLTLHAAVVQRNGRTFLLAGPSGAGKTTLSVALARAGWSFGSDELVLLGRELDLRALPLPPCIKADTFPLIETWFPELRTAPEHKRYGNIVKYLPIKPTPLGAAPGHVLFPRYRPIGPNEVRPLDSFIGLERLLAQCVFVPSGFQHDDVERLLQWHGGLRYFDIAFNDCDAAIALLTHPSARGQPGFDLMKTSPMCYR